MFFSTLLSDLVLTLSSALYVPHATIETSALLKYPRCESAASRREWRTLSIDEKANWISAVNCLANLPHDDALNPTFDTSFSRIPIVNSSSSYYDGEHSSPSINPLPSGMHLCSFFPTFTRLRVHAYGCALFGSYMIDGAEYSLFFLDLNYKIHFTGLFFPWHRWYLQVFEDSLKSKCGYRGASPYWNWALGDTPVS